MIPVKLMRRIIPHRLLSPFSFDRREVGANDVRVEFYFAAFVTVISPGRDEWGDSIYPMVPRHEM